MVLEFCEYGDLSRHNIQEIPEEQVLKLLAQLVKALKYAKGRGVLHHDIKLENILIDGLGVVKLGDFGICMLCSQFDEPGVINDTTNEYMSPEGLLK
jgi:serine/threonine protein kinase